MRVLSLVLACQMFLLPQLINSQKAMAIVEERGAQPLPILEEEVLKHALSFRAPVHSGAPDRDLVAHFHQYEEMMLDHPLREVPHQPPRS